MECINVELDAEVSSEPLNPQVTRKVSYVNDSGMTLTIHLPCGETIRIPSRESNCARMVLSVYVTYTLSSTVGINGIQERTEESCTLIEHVNGRGSVTIKYELKDFTDIIEGKVVMMDPLKLAVTVGADPVNRYPSHDPKPVEGVQLCFYTKGIDGYLTHAGNIIRFRRGGDGSLCDNKVYVALMSGDYSAELGTVDQAVISLPFGLSADLSTAMKQLAASEKIANDKIALSEVFYETVAVKHQDIANKSRGVIIDNINDELETQTKRRQLEQKNYYENRSYHRKDSSETLKYLPALVSGIGVAVGLLL